MLGNRVVDIWFSETGSYGSGYLLSNELVITARHVIKPAVFGASCQIGITHLPNPRRKARVCWLSGDCDVALVQLDEPLASDIGPSPTFGRLGADHDSLALYQCVAAGFPTASKRKDRRVERILSGTSRRLSSSSLFEIEVPTAPARAQGWSGFSGAAVFSGGLLCGVTVDLPIDWGGKILNAVPIEPLLSDPSFLKILADFGLPDFSIEPLRKRGHYEAIYARLKDQFCWVDREDQEALFRQSISQGGRAFVFEGGMRDRPEWLIDRLERDPHYREMTIDAPPGRAIVQITWPGFRIDDHDMALANLKAMLVDRLALSCEPASDLPAFLRALNLRGPTSIWWMLDPTRMGPGHAMLLKQWVEFCAALQRGHASFFWFVCWVQDGTSEPRRRFTLTKPALPDPEVEPLIVRLAEAEIAVSLEGLRPIYPLDDALPWLERLKDQARWHPELCNDVQQVIKREIDGQSRPLAQFAQDVRDALRGSDEKYN